MSKISFEGLGDMVATFVCEEGVAAGQVVKMTDNGTVGPCGDGEAFCGVALSAQDGYAAVQVAGLVELPVTGGGVTVGWVKLSADGSGGVKADDVAGRETLVVWADSDSAVVCL